MTFLFSVITTVTNTFFLLLTLEQKTSCSLTDWQAEMTGNGKWFRVLEFPAVQTACYLEAFEMFVPWSSPERRPQSDFIDKECLHKT